MQNLNSVLYSLTMKNDKLRNSTLIIGEGPTEFYYFNSLRGEISGVTIEPDYPKHTSVMELGKKIAEGIAMGYPRIFCVVDMDTKVPGTPEFAAYSKLRDRYSKPVSNRRRGIYCEVRFFETHRCTELFFLYYFRYTSKAYNSQDALLSDLNKECPYEKTQAFFMKCKGLHRYFEKHGGSLSAAIRNADKSMAERMAFPRDYTYSELGIMMRELGVGSLACLDE